MAAENFQDSGRTESDLVTRLPLWSIFDADWYIHNHPGVTERMRSLGIADAEQFYREHGAKLGHSPNMFFDEAWYLRCNPDVAAFLGDGGFASGFAHYCHDGYRGRSPHWLFSEKLYLSAYPDVTRGLLDRHGLVNGYDHYLTLGDRGFRSGHWFFDAMLYHTNKPEADGSDPAVGGAFAQFLAGGCIAGSLVRLSWYFDPVWYLETYPAVRDEIEAGLWRCALQHFLCNPAPQQFQALPWFSEAFYAETYPDVQKAVESGLFRNTYEHFVRHGAAECRTPHRDIDLVAYFDSGRVQADIEGGAFRDPFAHWLSRLDASPAGSLPGIASAPLPGAVPEAIAESQSKQLFARAAENMLPQLARRPLDFTVGHAPTLSVIVVLHNQFALTMMAMASLRANFAGSLELILVDSGSHDETRHIERYITGVRLIRFAHNAGFVQGCNAALVHVTAPVLLYLNNDLLLGLDAVRLGLDRLVRDPGIGGVGGKLIRTNGLLQEAGSIIWRDGTTFGYLRGADPNTPEANFVRDVDYCSGAFLMLRTQLVRQLGGFDDAYRPAYYEEADLCVRLRKAGWRIVYDPSIVIQHFEFGSADITASTRLMQRNHKTFVARHLDYLRYQHPSRPHHAVHARSPRPVAGQNLSASQSLGASQNPGPAPGDRPLRILFIEDRIPLRHLGSGYVRSNDIIHAMAALGHQVSVFPIYKATASPIAIYRDMPETTEVLHERGMEALAGFITDRAGYYDVVWIGRTHNLERLLPILGDCAAALPAHGFVLDTEAVAAPRTLEQNRVLGRRQTETLDAALRRELACAYFCQKIIAVNEQDAALVRSVGHSNVCVLGHMQEPRPTPATWSQRHNLLFLGAIHDPGSPNHDSLQWFTTQVLPLLEDRLPEMRLTIAGFVRRGVDLSELGRNPRVDLIGPVEDLADLYNSHRVFIAPTRFAGGIPFKIHEAASYGLPVVATDLLCQQVGWNNHVEIIAGGTNNPQHFANAVVSLYKDAESWNTIRRGAIKRLVAENSRSRYADTLRDILRGMGSQADQEPEELS